jgi:prepilin-type processing-associated H-X9-DG protein
MYLGDFKGVIVFPQQEDPNFNPRRVFWHQRLSQYLNKRDTRGNTADVSELSAVVKGCPEWEGIDNTGDGKPDSDKIGYGMSRRLMATIDGTGSGINRFKYHAPADGIAGNGPLDNDHLLPGYVPPPWKITMIKKPSSRILFGDSRNTNLDPSVPSTSRPAGWDLTFSLIQATSGDIGRHAGPKVVKDATDPGLKQMRANYCFVDGHVETLDPVSAERAINNPR